MRFSMSLQWMGGGRAGPKINQSRVALQKRHTYTQFGKQIRTRSLWDTRLGTVKWFLGRLLSAIGGQNLFEKAFAIKRRTCVQEEQRNVVRLRSVQVCLVVPSH